MTHEQLVPTLETCIHAKDVGYLQGKSHFVWLREKGGMWKLVSNKVLYLAAETVDAPTLQELLEELRLGREVFVKNIGNDWHIGNYKHNRETEKMEFDPNPAEAAALLWLKLHKHKEVA